MSRLSSLRTSRMILPILCRRPPRAPCRLPVLAAAAALALTAALWPALAPSASADLGGFVITDFHTDLTVEPDTDLLVEETIQVDFREPRHGIYRVIPIRYTDPRGFEYGLSFRLLDVTDEDGRSHDTKVSRDGQDVNIRIGDEDRTVVGPVTYVIRYRVGGAVQAFDTHDELYWNAVGDEWATDIQQASATVHLPGELPAEDVRTAAYSGPFGSREGGVAIAAEDGGTVAYESEAALGPYDAMTVVAAWPKGLVSFPSPAWLWLQRLLRNWVILLPTVALLWTYRRYRKLGVDPEGRGSITVQYEPPEGLGPGEIGTIVDEKVDMRDITATLVDLAVRDYLRIVVEEKKGWITRSEETAFVRHVFDDDPRLNELLPHERKVFDGIFQHGRKVTTDDLNEEFYTELPGIKGALYGHLVDEGYFSESPDDVRTREIGIGVLWVAAVFGIGVGVAWLTGAIFPYAFIVPAVAAALTALCVFPFVRAMPRRTRAGVRMREWALGFQEFVDRVEADRLERAEAITAFERLLPYAMALGVAAKWAKQFEGIYEEGRSPGWYVAPHHTLFSTYALEQSLSKSMSSVATSMAAAPRSSGSSGVGGGGFSGGGFGGGGGGSW